MKALIQKLCLNPNVIDDGLPESLYNAVAKYNWPPIADRFGVTSLIEAPLIRTLKIKHWDDLQFHSSKMLWMLYGTAVDTVLKNNTMWGLTNIKLVHPVTTSKGVMKVVARPDYYGVLDYELSDFKMTSVKAITTPERIQEWTLQVNLYKYIMGLYVPQLKIDSLAIHALLKDWRGVEEMRKDEYPPFQYKYIPLRIMPEEEIKTILIDCLKDHVLNSTRECTPAEKWAVPTTWAVVNPKTNRAVKGGAKHETEQLARNFKSKHKDSASLVIDKRPGKNTKCEGYCDVKAFCPYYGKGF